LYVDEGYLFVTQPPEKETNVYRYQVTLFNQSAEPLRGIHTEFLLTAERSLSNTYENLKLNLIKQFVGLPNPSVYLVSSKVKFPYAQTLMPVAKRLLVRQITKSA
jgi:hypothetical protein